MARKLESLRVVEKFESNLFEEMLTAFELENTRAEFLTGKAFEMLSVLFESSDKKK